MQDEGIISETEGKVSKFDFMNWKGTALCENYSLEVHQLKQPCPINHNILGLESETISKKIKKL